jgi:hypothetical protein
MFLVVTASVAYLVLPRGRLCPHCGGVTSPVVLRRVLRLLSPWLQWRWCSRCSWEGPGRRSPDLGPLDPPADHGTGFQWGAPNSEEAPIFYWRSDAPGGDGKGRPNNPSGSNWQSSSEPPDPTEPDQHRFDLGPPGETRPRPVPWERKRHPGRRSGDDGRRRTPHPWYLSWLVSKDPPGFQWRERGD